jgi:4-amino-4-deoxychorismate lyase
VEGAFRQGLLDDPGLRLIETMLWDGARYPRLAGHLRRMTVAAGRLGFVFAGFGALPAPVGAARVRVTLSAAEMTCEVGSVPAATGQWRLGLAGVQLVSGDPWLSVKSTRRPAYEAARAAMGPGLDEVVLLNERGEVCDGTISTLFFDRGAGRRTPPLASGVLPGVLRAGLIRAGVVREEVLLPQDLGRVRLWAGNALRGLVPAVWAGQFS